MRSAEEILKELVLKAQPPAGCPIVLTEAVKITKAEDVQNRLLISRNAYLRTDTGKQIRVGGLISPLATIFLSVRLKMISFDLKLLRAVA